MSLIKEIKRKVFHHFSLVYLVLCAVFPRMLTLIVLGLILVAACALEFLRLRRPELNQWLLEKFRGIHREKEVMAPSGAFWMLLGCWLTMLIFVDRLIGVTAIGFLVYGDTAAALVGQTIGKHPWPKNPKKTMEGSAAFAIVSFLWALLLIKPHGALIGALAVAWVESLEIGANDNFWTPLVGAFAISLCLGSRAIHGNPYVYLIGRTVLFTVVFAVACAFWLKKFKGAEREA